MSIIPIGAETVVTTTTDADRIFPAITALVGDGHVVAGVTTAPGYFEVDAQFDGASGNAPGSEVFAHTRPRI